VHHGVGEQASGDALDRQRVTPVEGSRQQANGRRREDDPQRQSDHAGHGRAGGALAHPAPPDPSQKDRQQKRGDADGLQDSIRQPCSDQAGPVVGRPQQLRSQA